MSQYLLKREQKVLRVKTLAETRMRLSDAGRVCAWPCLCSPPTWPFCLDDGLGRDADAAVVERQLAAGQAVGPAVVVALHHRLAALLGPLTHTLTGFDGLMLEVDGADGSVHGAQEEEQVGAAAGP